MASLKKIIWTFIGLLLLVHWVVNSDPTTTKKPSKEIDASKELIELLLEVKENEVQRYLTSYMLQAMNGMTALMIYPSYFYNYFWALFYGYFSTDLWKNYPFTDIFMDERPLGEPFEGKTKSLTVILNSPEKTIQYVFVVSKFAFQEKHEKYTFSYIHIVPGYRAPSSVFFIVLDPRKKLVSAKIIKEPTFLTFTKKQKQKLVLTHVIRNQFIIPTLSLERNILEITRCYERESEEQMGKLIMPLMEVFKKAYNSRSSSEAGQHGTIAGVLSLFRKRFNVLITQELMFGSRYVDTTVLIRGPQRVYNAIPIAIQVKAGRNLVSEGLKEAVEAIQNVRPETNRLNTNAKKTLAVGINLASESDWVELRMVELDHWILADVLHGLMGHLEQLTQLPEELNDKVVGDYLDPFSEVLKKYLSSFPGRKEQKQSHYFSRFLLGYFASLKDIEVKTLKEIPHMDTYIVEHDHNLRGLTDCSKPKDITNAYTPFFLKKRNSQFNLAIHVVEANKIAMKKIDNEFKFINDRDWNSALNILLRFDVDTKKLEYEMLNDNRLSAESSAQNPSMYITFHNPSELEEKMQNFFSNLNTERLSEAFKDFLLALSNCILFPVKRMFRNEGEIKAAISGAARYFCENKNYKSDSDTCRFLSEYQTGNFKLADHCFHNFQQNVNQRPFCLEVKWKKQLKHGENDELLAPYLTPSGVKFLTDHNNLNLAVASVNPDAQSYEKFFDYGEIVNSKILHSSLSAASSSNIKTEMEREVLASTSAIPNIMMEQNFEINFVSCQANEYWLSASDVTAIARLQYNIPTDHFQIIGVDPNMRRQLGNLIANMRIEGRQYSVVLLNHENVHWTALVLWLNPRQMTVNGYYVDSFGQQMDNNLRYYLGESGVARINDLSSIQQQRNGDSFNCGFWALMNAMTIRNQLQSGEFRNDEIQSCLETSSQAAMNSPLEYFRQLRQDVFLKLTQDRSRRDQLIQEYNFESVLILKQLVEPLLNNAGNNFDILSCILFSHTISASLFRHKRSLIQVQQVPQNLAAGGAACKCMWKVLQNASIHQHSVSTIEIVQPHERTWWEKFITVFTSVFGATEGATLNRYSPGGVLNTKKFKIYGYTTGNTYGYTTRNVDDS